jgi:hypothetical protein
MNMFDDREGSRGRWEGVSSGVIGDDTVAMAMRRQRFQCLSLGLSGLAPPRSVDR